MDLYSRPIDQVCYTDVDDFLRNKFPESEILEYKSDWPNDLERWLAAFANTNGGLVLIGVEEEKGTGRPKLPAEGVDLTEGEDAIRRCIGSKAYDGIYPPIAPEVAVCPNPNNPSRGVIVIRVPESHETPHATDSRQRIYVRVKSQNRFLVQQATLEEIERLWHRRKAAKQHREHMIRQARGRVNLMRRSVAAKQSAHGAVIECYAVPLFPDQPRLDMAELLHFAENTRAVGRANSIFYDFPYGVWVARPIADGIAILPSSSSSREPHFVQINRWGMLHSHLCIEPREEPQPYYLPWFVAHIDAYLQYLCRFTAAFAEVGLKPILISISSVFPPESRILTEYQQQYNLKETQPVFDAEIHLLTRVLLARELEGESDNLLAESAGRLLQAAGLRLAVEKEKVQAWLQKILGGSGDGTRR